MTARDLEIKSRADSGGNLDHEIKSPGHVYGATGKRDSGGFWFEACSCGTRVIGHGRSAIARHCTTCHADQHLACLGCGACLPSTARTDRRTCDDRCRQRLHRHPTTRPTHPDATARTDARRPAKEPPPCPTRA